MTEHFVFFHSEVYESLRTLEIQLASHMDYYYDHFVEFCVV